MALVVGNSAYVNTPPLRNPENDANDVASQLTALGFRVILGLNLDKAGLDAKIAEFAEALSQADVGVFFYGGHGLQVGGQNYLVPIDSKLSTPSALDFEMVPLDLVQRAMERDAKTSIIFLDACRDNPLARNLARALSTRSLQVSRGLAAVESGIGTLISFSTQPGNVALDGEGRNSPFAAALIKHLADEDSVMDILINVRNSVVAETRQQQVPWEHSALRSKFYFKAPKSLTPARPEARKDPSYEQQVELALWNTVSSSKSPELLEAFLRQFPRGTFANTARIMIEVHKQERAIAELGRQAAKEPAPAVVTAALTRTNVANDASAVDAGSAPQEPVKIEEAKGSDRKKAERPSSRKQRTRLSSEGGASPKARACTPNNGPHGYYDDPWCNK